MPKVSIIVPCWNVEKYLNRCLESIVAQSLSDIEIILVDDESPDRVPQICDEWALKDKRIRVLHKKNEGLGMACNSGLELASGEFVAFCDSDDWVDAEMYQTMYDAALIHGADMVFTGLKRVDMQGSPCGNLPHPQKMQLFKGKEQIDKLSCDIIASAPSVREERSPQMSAKVVLYKNEIIKKNHLRFYSERIIPSEDLHFNLQMLANSSVVCVFPVYFYNYMVNPNSITRMADMDRFKKSLKLYHFLDQECNQLGINPEYKTRINRLLLGQARSCLKLCMKWDIPSSIKKEFIKNLCNVPEWNSVWEVYPLKKMPFEQRLVANLIKYKIYSVLYLLFSR